MDILNSLTSGIGFILAVLYLFTSWAKEPVDQIFLAIVGPNGFIVAIEKFFDWVSKESDKVSESIDKFLGSELNGQVDQYSQAVNGGVKRVRESLQHHISFITKKVISFGSEHTTWRILGAVVEMVFLVLFFYADAAQGLNNISGIEAFRDYVAPPLFRNLAIPLVVSSIGSAAALGLILFDLLGVTHLAPWDKLKDRPRKIILGVVIANMIFSILLAAMLALSRLPIIIPGLSQEVVQSINIAVGVAQSLVIVILAITTVLLFWGFAGLLVLYVAAIAAIAGTLGLVEVSAGLLSFVLKLIVGVANSIGKMVLFLFKYIFLILGFIFDWVLKLFVLAHKFIDFFTYPLREVIQFFRVRFGVISKT